MTADGKHQTLANVLLDKQIILPKQLEQAVEYQKEHQTSLDQALMQLDILSEADLSAIYADVLQVRALKLEDVDIDREAVRHIPASVAHKHHLIPVRRSGNSLAVAMADPVNSDDLAALRAVTDFDIIPFASRYDAIEHALYVHYGEPASDDGAPSDPSGSDALARPRNLIEDDPTGHVGKSIQLNRHATFDSFIKDVANEFPLSIARSIADLQAEDTYNPFHCWGSDGSGKTHLLHAIAAYVAAHSPLKRYILTSGQRFVDDLFQSIRDKKVNFFRYLYRESDLLLIDDADALLSRDWAQRELVETFKHLQRSGKHLVLASTRNLAAEPKTTPTLRIALESGVIAGFSAYSGAAKLSIARAHAGSVELPKDVLERLVARSGGNLNDMLNVMQQLTVMAVLDEGHMSADLVDDIIQLYGIASRDGASDRARGLASTTVGNSAATGSTPDDTHWKK
jgi:chromosomal replication initiation ATPase DnaA